jgi:TonB-linked SusC/RagA family outer membrane protein
LASHPVNVQIEKIIKPKHCEIMQINALWSGYFYCPTFTKTMRVMKLSAILLLGFFLHVSAKGVSQTISFTGRNVPLQRAFSAIKDQTGYLVVYNSDLLDRSKGITISVKDQPLEVFLQEILKNQALDYIIEKKTIVISGKIVPASPESEPVNQPLPPITIMGRVLDENGAPMTGVSVMNQATKSGTFTDAKGEFTLAAKQGETIEFSFVGYGVKQIRVGASTSRITVVLARKSGQLEETVVIGYGSTQRKDLTGSVATISPKDVEDLPFNTIDNAIAGKAAGVQVTKSDGTPGGAVRIRIRGSSSLLGDNDPLYVIDGVPLQITSNYINPGFSVGSPAGNDINAGGAGIGAALSSSFVNGLNSLAGLNIDDIESITILKDASSTAIYGSKAANGVVIITTKKGRKGMTPQITVNYNNTFTKPINPKVLNASQYRTLITEAAQNDYDYNNAAGNPIPQNTNAIVNQPGSFFGKANTNWLDLVTRNTSSNNVEVAVQGGSATSKYYTSISYNSTPGVVVATTYQRIAGKLSLENDIGKRFRFLTNMNLGNVKQNLTDGAYAQALRARPDFSPYDSTGAFTNFSTAGATYQGLQNPLALTTATDNSQTFSLLGSLSGEYDILNGLMFKSAVSLNMNSYNQRNYMPSYVDISNYDGNVSSNGGIGSNSNSRFADWFLENTLTYHKMFSQKHALNVLAGTSYETTKSSFFSATGSGYPNDNTLNNLSSAITPLIVQGDDPGVPQSYLLSFYMRANYSFMDKYLFTLTGRADGSSKFGPDNKFGYFPSGAVAWRVSQENFLKDVKWIDDIKLRGSYGLTGTQNIGNQMYRTLYNPYSYGGNNALVPYQLGNPAIKWETTKEANGGVDFAFFKGRLQGTVDYYNKQTSGVLLNLPVAPSGTFPTLLSNSASIKNTGYEVSLQGDIIRTRNFKWSASVNITWNKSLVTKIDPSADLSQIANQTGLEDGTPPLSRASRWGV